MLAKADVCSDALHPGAAEAAAVLVKFGVPASLADLFAELINALSTRNPAFREKAQTFALPDLEKRPLQVTRQHSRRGRSDSRKDSPDPLPAILQLRHGGRFDGRSARNSCILMTTFAWKQAVSVCNILRCDLQYGHINFHSAGYSADLSHSCRC